MIQTNKQTGENQLGRKRKETKTNRKNQQQKQTKKKTIIIKNVLTHKMIRSVD